MMSSKISDLSNVQLMALAIDAAGGRTKAAHLEDVAIAADKIVPGRFRWQKKKEFISDRLIVNWLSDARKETYGSLAVGKPEDGYALTQAGRDFVDLHKHLIGSAAQEKYRIDKKQKDWIKKEKQRVLAEAAYRKLLAGNNLDSITTKEVETLFRINEYIQGNVRVSKIAELVDLFDDDNSAQKILKMLGQKLTKESSHVTSSN